MRAERLSGTREEWFSTESAARVIGGVTPRWVRLQVEAGRLPVRVLLTGRRPTYRIRRRDLAAFVARYVLDDAGRTRWVEDGLRRREGEVSAVGALLRTMRRATARPVDDVGAAAGIAPARLRRLERGSAELEYLEGIRLAKALDLCPNCFRRLLEAAAERDAYAHAASTTGLEQDAPVP